MSWTPESTANRISNELIVVKVACPTEGPHTVRIAYSLLHTYFESIACGVSSICNLSHPIHMLPKSEPEWQGIAATKDSIDLFDPSDVPIGKVTAQKFLKRQNIPVISVT